jgi:predicted nucleic acid-binding Zn ribbon protein
MRLSKEPFQLGDLVEIYARSIGITEVYLLSLIKYNWEEIVGEVFAKRVKLQTLKDGILTVAVNSSSHRVELGFRKKIIIDKINELLNKGNVVKDIIIR